MRHLASLAKLADPAYENTNFERVGYDYPHLDEYMNKLSKKLESLEKILKLMADSFQAETEAGSSARVRGPTPPGRPGWAG